MNTECNESGHFISYPTSNGTKVGIHKYTFIHINICHYTPNQIGNKNGIDGYLAAGCSEGAFPLVVVVVVVVVVVAVGLQSFLKLFLTVLPTAIKSAQNRNTPY